MQAHSNIGINDGNDASINFAVKIEYDNGILKKAGLELQTQINDKTHFFLLSVCDARALAKSLSHQAELLEGILKQ